MKSKEILTLVLFGVVLAVVATLLVGRLGNSKARHSAQIEVVNKINPEFNQEARVIVRGENPDMKVETFDPSLLLEGLNNTAPFRPQD